MEDKYTKDYMNIPIEIIQNVIEDLLTHRRIDYYNRLATIKEIIMFINVIDYLQCNFI